MPLRGRPVHVGYPSRWNRAHALNRQHHFPGVLTHEAHHLFFHCFLPRLSLWQAQCLLVGVWLDKTYHNWARVRLVHVAVVAGECSERSKLVLILSSIAREDILLGVKEIMNVHGLRPLLAFVTVVNLPSGVVVVSRHNAWYGSFSVQVLASFVDLASHNGCAWKLLSAGVDLFVEIRAQIT